MGEAGQVGDQPDNHRHCRGQNAEAAIELLVRNSLIDVQPAIELGDVIDDGVFQFARAPLVGILRLELQGRDQVAVDAVLPLDEERHVDVGLLVPQERGRELHRRPDQPDNAQHQQHAPGVGIERGAAQVERDVDQEDRQQNPQHGNAQRGIACAEPHPLAGCSQRSKLRSECAKFGHISIRAAVIRPPRGTSSCSSSCG